MHDGGGDRSPTVAALRLLLPALQVQGIRVDTVSWRTRPDRADGVGLDRRPLEGPGPPLRSAVERSSGRGARLDAPACRGTVRDPRRGRLVAAVRHHQKRRRKRWGPPVTGPVSIIVPAYNEQAGIEATVRSLSPRHSVEVIVVDNGSRTGRPTSWRRLVVPGLVLMQQTNAGKPAALNAGIAAASHDLVVMVDGDTVLEPDAVRRIVQPFADSRVGAVSGNAKVANRHGFLGRWQHIEYVVGFNLDRRLFDLGGVHADRSRCDRSVRRSALKRIGGVSASTLAEDTDLTMALCRDGWRVVYEERAIAWTETPATLGRCGGSGTAGATGRFRPCGSTVARCCSEVRPGGWVGGGSVTCGLPGAPSVARSARRRTRCLWPGVS